MTNEQPAVLPRETIESLAEIFVNGELSTKEQRRLLCDTLVILADMAPEDQVGWGVFTENNLQPLATAVVQRLSKKGEWSIEEVLAHDRTFLGYISGIIIELENLSEKTMRLDPLTRQMKERDNKKIRRMIRAVAYKLRNLFHEALYSSHPDIRIPG